MLKFFTQKAEISAPTYFKHFNNKLPGGERDWPLVKMTTDISLDESQDEHDNPEIFVAIHNKMWDDPEKSDDGDTEPISVYVFLDAKQVAYIYKYLEAFLKTNQIL